MPVGGHAVARTGRRRFSASCTGRFQFVMQRTRINLNVGNFSTIPEPRRTLTARFAAR
jgi:hypothetical protein